MTDPGPSSSSQDESLVGRLLSVLKTTPWILTGIVVLCVGIEALLSLGDLGLLPAPRLRATAYEYGGFWSGLLRAWRPNFSLQPYTMFLSYAFLHGGVTHMVVNMISLWSLGLWICDRVGNTGFAILYFGSVLGGGACFGMLASQPLPMVGASGGLFGLVGGILAWNYVDRFHNERALWPVLQMVGALLLLNLVLWWAMNGFLAWETHLGGFVSGWVIALLIDPRSRESDPESST